MDYGKDRVVCARNVQRKAMCTDRTPMGASMVLQESQVGAATQPQHQECSSIHHTILRQRVLEGREIHWSKMIRVGSSK